MENQQQNVKQLRSQNFKDIILFLTNLGIIFPIWLTFLLPSTIIWNLFKFILLKFKIIKRKNITVNDSELKELINKAEVIPINQRQYDLILFGATGFTGKLAAQYLSKNYSNKIKWALAGRDELKLKKLLAEINQPNLKVLIADSFKPQTLVPIIKNTRCVITTVGPYDRYGENLLGLCAAYGTNYCDITGEVKWVRRMIEKYDELAAKTKANIVNCCGADSIPWDLITFKVNQQLQQGEKLTKIECFDEMVGNASGGTIETLFNSLTQSINFKSQLGFDPLLKLVDSKQGSTYKTVSKIQQFLGYKSIVKSWVGMWVLSPGNMSIVKRSNALQGYNNKFIYYEGLKFPGFLYGFNYTFGLILLATCLFNPILSHILRRFFLPIPGQGPSKEIMDQGFLRLIVFGYGDKGSKIKGQFYFPDDPGYRDTARMLVEAGLCLSIELDKIKSKGGILTPASCQGEVLIKRLCDTGCTLYFEKEDKKFQ